WKPLRGAECNLTASRGDRDPCPLSPARDHRHPRTSNVRHTARVRCARVTSNPSRYAQARYDEVAPDYDRLWSRYMELPQARLTAGLALSTGQTLADIACGTGAITVEMALRTWPGDVVAVDCSENMLEAARLRAAARGIALHLVHAAADVFVETCAPASFDVVSCRFALAYMDWRALLPRLGRLLRPG